MSINKKAQRIDLDTEDNIYHLKVTSVGGGGGLSAQPGRGTGSRRREGQRLKGHLSLTRGEFLPCTRANGKLAMLVLM